MSFDTLAPYYRRMEWVLAGGVLQKCRTAFLGETVQCQRALLLGEGPGKFLVELLERNPVVKVTCVDKSPRMLEAARKFLPREAKERVSFVVADALDWEAGGKSFDLIVTHFFLDCFRPEELAALVPKIAGRATTEARWLAADFCEPTAGWQKWRARLVLKLMYGFFRVVTGISAKTLTSPDAYIRAGGFRLAKRKLANFGLAHSDLWVRQSV